MLIGEVARRSGVSARMLRHYDALGLVRPTGRTTGGYREYSEEDIERIFHVESLRSLGLSLSDVQRALEDPDFDPAALVTELIAQARQRLAREETLLARLLRVQATGPTDWDDVLRIVALLRALGSTDAVLRHRAALSLGPGEALPAEALAQAVLAEVEPNTAGAMRWALARAGHAALAAVAAGLDSPQAEVRQRAVTAISEVAAPEATTLLLGALTDPDNRVRERAALALGRRGRTEAVPVLVLLVAEGRSDVEAAEILGALAGPVLPPGDVVACLLRTGDDAAPHVRRRVAQALAEIPGTAARDALARLAEDGDRAVSLTAAAVLRRRAEPSDP